MELGTEILAVGKADLPMGAGISVTYLSNHLKQFTIGFSDSEFDVFGKSLG
jgi:hypothetical protein